MKPFAVLVSAAALISAGCATHDESVRVQIEQDLRADLAVGDSSEKIERVLQVRGISFDYDALARRYQAYFDPKEQRHVKWAVGIYLYVDDQKRLTKFEIRNVYTYL